LKPIQYRNDFPKPIQPPSCSKVRVKASSIVRGERPRDDFVEWVAKHQIPELTERLDVLLILAQAAERSVEVPEMVQRSSLGENDQFPRNRVVEDCRETAVDELPDIPRNTTYSYIDATTIRPSTLVGLDLCQEREGLRKQAAVD
jgi:hypothetical protein